MTNPQIVTLKDLKERYMVLMAWYMLHEEITEEKIAKVLDSIGDVEDKLRAQDVDDEQLKIMSERTKIFVNSKLSDLSPQNQERLIQLIFGTK